MHQLLTRDFKGVCVIAATPFTDNSEVDFESIDSLVDFYLAAGVSGMTVLGMMGEANKLSEDDSIKVMSRFVTRTDGRVPVVVGVSNPGLDNLAGFTKRSMDFGAAGVMVAPISTSKTEEQVFRYFETVCSAIGSSVPVVLQDYPFVTTVNISVDTIHRICDNFEQVVMLKHEDMPGLEKLSRLREAPSDESHKRVSILVGNGGLYLPQELARGADGAMTGFAYPEMLVKVVKWFEEGKQQEAEDLFDIYLPLLRHEFQPGFGLALRKEVLRRRGAIKSAALRRPGACLSKLDHDELTKIMDRLDRRLV
ncbi:MAG TPA: dihydrodipicolinate synthase family protein [Rhizobium sp.]